jgi:hypothetical protein
MAAGRVTGSQEAKQEIQQMKQDFQNDLNTMKSQFSKHNSILSDPNHWEGRHAQEYRNNIAPQINNMLNKWQNDFTQLATQMDKIMQDILTAGGN